MFPACRPVSPRRRRPAFVSTVTAAWAAATLATVVPLVVAGCDDDGGSSLPANTAVEAGLQRVLDDGVASPDATMPGAIAYYHASAYRAWSGAAGLGELATATAMRGDDRVRAGSILKTFIATVTLQHVEEGALSLEQTLTALLPGPVTAPIAGADQITLRMLLNHTSGIPEWVTPDIEARIVADPAHIWTPEECLAIATSHPPTFAPGAGWAYSNTDYTVVGMILDRRDGKTWRRQVRERVIDRLGLARTSLPEPGDTGMPGAHAHGYQPTDDGVIDATAIDPSMAGAAGGHALVTTAEDLGRFLEALLAGQLFARPETLAQMTTMIDATHVSGLPYRYGLGLEQFTLPDGTVVVGHSGSTAGYASMMFRIPARDTTLVTSVNIPDLFVNALDLYIPAVAVINGAG
jgi:D-alanyl-D-alanine carboxypeptidase